MSAKNINKIFEEVQKNEACHQKYLKMLDNIYKKIPFEEFVEMFMNNIKRVFVVNIIERNHFVQRLLDFCAQFVALITKQIDYGDDPMNDEPSHPFLTVIVKETLKFHNLVYVEARYHSCKFITLILQHLGYQVQLDNDICDTIQEAMLDRIVDHKSSIRIQAVTALVRLQEPLNPDCPVVKAYLTAFYDINLWVRREVVMRVAPNAITLTKIKERVLDVEAHVRIAAFQRCADIGPKSFKIVERQSILSSGFSESNKQVRKVFIGNLLPKWLTYYNGNYLQFLSALKLDADEHDIEVTASLSRQVMEVFFLKNPIDDIIKSLPIDENKLIPLQNLTSDSVLYWCILVNFLRKLTSDDGEEYLERILPEFTPFCNYIDSFIKMKMSKVMDEWETFDFQFILYDLLEMADQFDTSDEVGRRTFLKLVQDLLPKYRFSNKITKKLVGVAEKLSNSQNFTVDMCNIISEIREPLVEEAPSTEKLKQWEFEMAQLKVKANILRGNKEDAIDREEYTEIENINKELSKVCAQIEELKAVDYSEKVRVVKDDVDTLCHCLDVLIATLEHRNVKKMSPALRTIYTEFVVGLLNCPNGEVNWRLLKCLSLFSIIDKEIAKENAKILAIPIATYRAIPNFNKQALLVSVAAVSDLVRINGLELYGDGRDMTMAETTQAHNTTRRRLYRNEDMDDVSLIDPNRMNVHFLVEITLDMLDDENDDIRNAAIEALAKLMLDMYPVNSQFISRMILKWYNPVSDKCDVVQQKLGLVIQTYAKTINGAKEVIEQAVIPILTIIANAPKTSPLADIDVDNILKFLAALTSTAGTGIVNIHTNIAHSLLNQVASKPHDNLVPYMTKMLRYLQIPIDNNTTIKELIREAELAYEDIVDKAPKKHIINFIKKLNDIDKIKEQTALTETSNTNEISSNNGTDAQNVQELMEASNTNEITSNNGTDAQNVQELMEASNTNEITSNNGTNTQSVQELGTTSCPDVSESENESQQTSEKLHSSMQVELSSKEITNNNSEEITEENCIPVNTPNKSNNEQETQVSKRSSEEKENSGPRKRGRKPKHLKSSLNETNSSVNLMQKKLLRSSTKTDKDSLSNIKKPRIRKFTSSDLSSAIEKSLNKSVPSSNENVSSSSCVTSADQSISEGSGSRTSTRSNTKSVVKLSKNTKKINKKLFTSDNSHKNKISEISISVSSSSKPATQNTNSSDTSNKKNSSSENLNQSKGGRKKLIKNNLSKKLTMSSSHISNKTTVAQSPQRNSLPASLSQSRKRLSQRSLSNSPLHKKANNSLETVSPDSLSDGTFVADKGRRKTRSSLKTTDERLDKTTVSTSLVFSSKTTSTPNVTKEQSKNKMKELVVDLELSRICEESEKPNSSIRVEKENLSSKNKNQDKLTNKQIKLKANDKKMMIPKPKGNLNHISKEKNETTIRSSKRIKNTSLSKNDGSSSTKRKKNEETSSDDSSPLRKSLRTRKRMHCD
ncbi:condensin complex subunit 3 isoform X2 [Aethina tumida]|uniref:condensin complex subunit 3 isoform X2 n=1 Tax=Aethina tumida TaxID=116153 RepID=UPI0021473FEE|nr:condensin complex subunit 3 isoform X2 [Aethina tumida]